MQIEKSVRSILKEIPPYVRVAAAVKSRTLFEIQTAISAGINILGENYIQEAESLSKSIGSSVQWHFIGHLQKNKVKKAVELFDMIETLDSLSLAEEINKRSSRINKIMPVLIEVNSGREAQKSGLYPEDAIEFVKKISSFANIRVQGLMTMGPFLDDPRGLRPFFRKTRQLFDRLRSLNIPAVDMKYLSMGMSDSYKTAIEEGANIIRLGTKIFGPR